MVYNKLHLFTVVMWLCLLAFICVLLSKVLDNKYLLISSNIILIISFIIGFIGILLRMYIMQRPPVTSLYESIIFVAVVVLFMALMLVRHHYAYIGAVMGSSLGGMLLLVAKGYEKEGDTMGTLIAVLDTHFWLATHVVTITIGYACSLVVALLGHVYVVRVMLKVDAESQKKMFALLRYNVLLALFFTVLGTILGGIWADQSWGRFWGWDPKENGAMLLAVWMTWLIHGWHGKFFKQFSYAMAASMSSLVLVLSWFGVNLLNVGLHSYGFTQNIALNMAIFFAVELAFMVICWVIYGRREKKSAV